ncbi:MAG: hypothetical protein HQK53_12205 [Oligoflexia bacterium]|nr:hypothetical protein [Oligoflexia bacterium]
MSIDQKVLDGKIKSCSITTKIIDDYQGGPTKLTMEQEQKLDAKECSR